MNTQFLKNYLQKMKVSGLERKIPNISENNAEFIGKILSKKNPKNILEIGTANGYSALSFCYWIQSLAPTPLTNEERQEKNWKKFQNWEIKIWEKQKIQENSQNQEIWGDKKFERSEIFEATEIFWTELTEVNDEKKSNGNNENWCWFQIFTIEYAWNAHIEAVEHFKNCKTKNIFPMWGDAKKIIPIFENNFFDVVYIDAMKKEYLDYFILSLPKAKNDAIFIIDDVEKFAHKMQNFYDFLAEKNIKFTLHKTDEDDSIMIIERKDILL